MTETKKKLIVIDDDEVFCRTLCRTLERHQLTTFYAMNKEQALQLAENELPDMAVLDLRLETTSGLSLIKPLLLINPNLRIVVLTGFASLTTAVQAVKLGAINYLAKPLNSEAVLHAFEETHPEFENVDHTPTPLKQLEWEHIQRVLDENDGNISNTARQLGMHRRTLQRKLKKRPKLD